MSELALKLIEKNKAARKLFEEMKNSDEGNNDEATTLDIGRCGLNKLPAELLKCVWLKKLIVSNDWWELTATGIWEKKQSANIGENNYINGLSDDFHELINLEVLVLAGDTNKWRLGDLNKKLELPKLKTLHLSDNSFHEFGFFLGLPNLKNLYLGSCGIHDLTFLTTLKSLEILDLSYNQISSIRPLITCKELTVLYLSNNGIKDVADLSKLTKLKSLSLSRNQINDCSFLEELTCLESLYLNGNQIKKIGSELQKLNNLQTLNLIENKITDIKEFKAFQHTLKLNPNFFINIKDNPIVKEFALEGSIDENYREGLLNSLAKFESGGIKEQITLPAKVILLGNHASGKSSLLYFIQNNKLADKTDSTHIIKIEKFIRKQKRRKNLPDAIFFDFGGQDYYHGIYRAFISSGSLQILIWNNLSNYNWLREGKGLDKLNTRDYNLRYWLGQKLYLEEKDRNNINYRGES